MKISISKPNLYLNSTVTVGNRLYISSAEQQTTYSAELSFILFKAGRSALATFEIRKLNDLNRAGLCSLIQLMPPV